MSPLEAAKRLADGVLAYDDEHERTWCGACNEHDRRPLLGTVDHAPDCPVPSLPTLVKALELAELYGIRFEEVDGVLTLISRRTRRAP